MRSLRGHGFSFQKFPERQRSWPRLRRAACSRWVREDGGCRTVHPFERRVFHGFLAAPAISNCRASNAATSQAAVHAVLRRACVTPHVAQKARHCAIDRRTTRHDGYALSLKHRKRIEEAIGGAKTVGGMAQMMCRSIERVRSRCILMMAANNLARLPRLLAA